MKIDKIKGILIKIFAPAICIYLIATAYIILTLLLAYVFYGEFNPNLYGLETCVHGGVRGSSCRPPLEQFNQFIGWNVFTRLIFTVSIIWMIILLAVDVYQMEKPKYFNRKE